MQLKLVRHTRGWEFIQNLEDRYGTREDLERLIKKDPENFLYHLDLEKWQYHLKNPHAVVEERETIFLRDPSLKLLDLKVLEVIRNEKPTSLDDLSSILEEDLETIQQQVHRLAQEGLLKMVAGPDQVQIPVVDFEKIEIEF